MSTTAVSSSNASPNIAYQSINVMDAFFIRTAAFKRLSAWAFSVCDLDKEGKIGKDELYAGILLVHLQLAKYTGAAACYPPTRQVIDELFEASDDDKSGYIDEEEFHQILVICCAQIASRIFVYYAIIIFLVPVVAANALQLFLHLDEWMGWNNQASSFFTWVEKFLTWGKIAEKVVNLTLFFFLVPMLFNAIDSYSKTTAIHSVARPVPASGADERKTK